MADEPSKDTDEWLTSTQSSSDSEMVEKQTNLKGDELQASIIEPFAAPVSPVDKSGLQTTSDLQKPAHSPSSTAPLSNPDSGTNVIKERYKEDELLPAMRYSERESVGGQDFTPSEPVTYEDDFEQQGNQQLLLSEQSWSESRFDWYKKSETLLLPEDELAQEPLRFVDEPVLRTIDDNLNDNRDPENTESHVRMHSMLEEIDAIGIASDLREKVEEERADTFLTQQNPIRQSQIPQEAHQDNKVAEPVLRALSKSITLGEDGRYFFAASDFGLSTDNPGAEYTVTITQLPTQGILVLDGEVVQANQAITASSAGDLVFIPAANAHGDDYASMRYTVSDGSQVSAPATLSIQVSAQSDDPEADPRILATTESADHSFTAADFGFRDADAGDTLQSITIKSLPVTGSLTYDGASVYVNQVIQASDIEKLLYTAPSVSSDQSASFGFTVSDGSASSEQQTFDISVQNRQWMSDNLLTDPSASDWRMSNWDREGSWTTLPFGGHDSITGQWQGNGAATKSQTINLLDKGYSAEYLDTEPNITVQDWFVSTNTAYSAQYQMQVELLDEYGSVIHSWQSSSVWATWSWNTVHHTLRNYGEGLRSIRFTHGGNGRGVVVDDTSVQIEDPTVAGSTGDDILRGARNNDILVGGAGDDILYGGFGNDTLLGGSGADTFVFEQGDQTETSIPTVDTIRNFSLSDGDVLDLSDMLIGESAETIDAYLDLATVNGNTEISVKDRANGQTVQKIVLDGVDLSSLGSESEIINNLLNNGNLNIDQ